jgi:protein kinase C substrate 80K-H
MPPRLLALLAGLALATTTAVAAPPPPRGVDPADAHLYAAAPFFCPGLTGLVPVPPARINDGYCDCVDGSDEPGALRGDGRRVCAPC